MDLARRIDELWDADELDGQVIEEAIASDLPGLVFSFVWALDLEEDHRAVAELIAPALAAGVRVDEHRTLGVRAKRGIGSDLIGCDPAGRHHSVAQHA